MSGWVAIGVLIVATAAVLWRLRMPAVVVTPALAVGLAGYVLTSDPTMESAPAPARAVDADAAPQLEAARKRLLQNTGDIGGWLMFADILIEQGKSERAVEGLRLATRAMPDSPDLWVGLGNALVRHAGGTITPAARLAFGRASAIDPDHPGPPYFLGLAWLQAGEPDEALKVFEALYSRSPTDAPYRPELGRLMHGARAMIAAGVDGGRFTPPQSAR
jgi:cytochrome c-type biogenesis protein CcmH/NrfG